MSPELIWPSISVGISGRHPCSWHGQLYLILSILLRSDERANRSADPTSPEGCGGRSAYGAVLVFRASRRRAG